VRLAGKEVSPEVYQTIWKHLKSDGMEDQAANHMTAEMLHHGEDFESSIEQYERNLSKPTFRKNTHLKKYLSCKNR